MRKSIIILMMCSMPGISGCSLYPYTEHAKCIKGCEEKFGHSPDILQHAACIKRCDREFGKEHPDKTGPLPGNL
ncbi:MAG: hypothetical protein ACLQPD_17205 [Desulfomonilaceae bacterium]